MFAAASHSNYANSAYLYLQRTITFENTNSKAYLRFENGGSVTRRSERCWVGFPNDLVTEQILMRSFKTTGGLKRGGGMSDVHKTIRLFSKPISLEYSTKMEEAINVLHTTTEQHKTATPSRLKIDKQDLLNIWEKLKDFLPFLKENTL